MEEAWRLRYNAFAIRRSHRAERFANMFDFAGFLGKKSVGPPSSSYPSVGLLNIAVSAVVAIQPRGGQPTKVAAKATGARKKAASSTKAKGAR